MPPPPPPRREARNKLKPPAAFRIPASRVKLRHLRAAAIGHLHPDKTVPRADRDRDRPARSARPAMPDTVTEQLAHQQGGVIPARVPGTEHPADECAGDPRPLRPPGHRHAFPDLRPCHQRTAFPGRPVPGKSPGPAGRMYGNARSTQRLTSSPNTRPARPVRGRPWKADGAHRPSWQPDAVRYVSVDTATQGPTALQGDTRWDKKETAQIAENSQLSGRFRRWWQVLGSNQRRLSRRFYRPLAMWARLERHRPGNCRLSPADPPGKPQFVPGMVCVEPRWGRFSLPGPIGLSPAMTRTALGPADAT